MVSERLNIVLESAKNKAYEKRVSQKFTIDDILDSILHLHKVIDAKADAVRTIVSELENITWEYGSEIPEADLRGISELLGITRDFAMQCREEYGAMTGVDTKGIAKKRLDEYGWAIDDLFETIDDLEGVFFRMRNDGEFEALTERI